MADKILANVKKVEVEETPDFNVRSKVVNTVLIGCMECHPGTMLNLPLSKTKQLQELGFVQIVGV
jgi:hypothetical protein